MSSDITTNNTLIINVDPQEKLQKLDINEVVITENGVNLAKANDNSEVKFNLEYNNEASEESGDQISNDEPDAHLPRVRVELDRLNYANESINNLELELEESKREFIETLFNSEAELAQIEKKISGHVIKSIPYYQDRMILNLAKQKYLTTKFEFETAQELYVAAKNMQMYAEENLENSTENNNENSVDKMILVKMLKMAKIKVSETEFSKQSCDLQQIEAFKVYDYNLKKVEQTEKKLKSSIVKSLKYFQQMALYNKELNFLLLKVEGLKSCLREAKTTYQQSLKNLEKISTEVHEQRSIHNNNSQNKLESNNSLTRTISPNSSTSTISSSSVTVMSHSSPDLTNLNETVKNTNEKILKSTSLTTLTETNKSSVITSVETVDSEKCEEEDYDKYFSDPFLKYSDSELNRSFTKTVHYSQKLDKNAICLLSDENIENLRLEKKLKKFANDLLNKHKTEEIKLRLELNKDNTSNETLSSNRSQFKMPFFSKN